MVFKKLAALVAVLILLATPAVHAAGESGAEIAGAVPYLLTATSDKNACCVECTMGNAVADAVRKYLNTDIAIVCGGDFKANLPAGDITWDELRSAFSEHQTLATTVVTISQLREILEVGVSHIQLNEAERIDVPLSVYDGFPQISGFSFQYDVTEPAGRRVYAIYFNDERLALDDDTIQFTLASTEYMMEGGYGLPDTDQIIPTDLTLADVMARYLNDGMPEYVRTEKRIRAMGTTEGFLSGSTIGIVVAIAVVLSLLGRRDKKRRMSYYGYYPR